jgi:pyruvate dehydrogenase E1 component alpha subunit
VKAPARNGHAGRRTAPPGKAVKTVAKQAAAINLQGVTPATLRSLYRGMVRIRLLDERMMLHQRQGRIGFYGSCTGQEATPIAVAEAVRPGDWIFPGLREGSAMLQRGYPLVDYLGQVFGNSADPCKGRQMPSHQADRRVNQVSWSSVIGTQFSHAVGAAMAAKIKGDSTVVVGFIGDGGTSAAEFHMAMNFAGVWKPPVVLICQNNQWAISVPAKNQTASETIAVKAKAYGIPGVRIDGNDAVAVYRTVKEAADRARRGQGPTFIEALTYRIGAHSSSDDPSRYRDQREVDAWIKRDPIEALQKALIAAKLLTAATDAALRAELSEEIAAAVSTAEAAAPPALSTMFEDVFSEELPHLTAERAEYEAFLAHVGRTKPEGHGG